MSPIASPPASDQCLSTARVIVALRTRPFLPRELEAAGEGGCRRGVDVVPPTTDTLKKEQITVKLPVKKVRSLIRRVCVLHCRTAGIERGVE